MRKIRVRELPNWPPEPGGSYPRAYESPTSEQALVTRVEPHRIDRHITFVAEFKGNRHTYDFEASTEKLAARLRELLGKNLPTTVFALGELEIETE